MKTSIPLSLFAELLDACEPSPLVEAIRAAFRAPEAELLRLMSKLPASKNPREMLVLEALDAYALHESGSLVSTSARLHHRARFYRCYWKVKAMP